MQHQDKGADRELFSRIVQNTEQRVRIRFEGTVRTPPENVFPLLCPKREEEWIDGWMPGIYNLIYTDSGVNEKHCVFQEGLTRSFLFGEPGPTTWVTTAHAPEAHALDFLLIFGETAVLNREVQCTATETNATLCAWTDTVTFLKGSYPKREREILLSKLAAFSTYLGVMLRHYCQNGQVLPVSAFFEAPGPEGLPENMRVLIQSLLSGS